jgi:K+-transporting ATPase KdpF subunit
MHDRPGFFRFLDTRRTKDPVGLRFARAGFAVKSAPPSFFNAPLTAQAVLFRGYEEEICGCYFHRRGHCLVRPDSLARAGACPPRGSGMNAMYIIGGLLALGLCVYLLYAMFKPEKF